MVTPSAEQQAIIDAVQAGKNVAGDCVAGSGKTTTVLLLAESCPKKNIILLTYNAALKLEVREKAVAKGITNLDANSYHSANMRYYMKGGRGHTDKAIRNVIESRIPLKKPGMCIDILVVDETQDMKQLFFSFAWKLYSDLIHKPQIVVLGDRFQGVYKFMDADTRFLTLAGKVWNSEFDERSLSTSYRVTNQIASFVNDVMIGQTRILAPREGPNVSYWKLHPWSGISRVFEFIQRELARGILPGDIFILAPSIKSATSPIRKLENMLAENKIPCYFPTSDESALDKDIISGKVVFTTYHSSKGRERKVVIIYGFDETYFKYYGKGLLTNVCPDTLYVAATRASEKLVLIQSALEKPLPFLKVLPDALYDLPYVSVFPPLSHRALDISQQSALQKNPNISASDLIQFIKEGYQLALKDNLELGVEIYEEASMDVDIPLKIETPTGHEDVSAINGIVIPMIQETRRTGEKSTVQVFVEKSSYWLKKAGEHPFLRSYIAKWNPEDTNIQSDILLGILFMACNSHLYHKLTQITKYDWLSYSLISPCIALLNVITEFSQSLKYEMTIGVTYSSETYGNYTLTGRIDIYDSTTIWEVKCVQSLTLEHELQLAIYAWMWKYGEIPGGTASYERLYGPRKFKLVNIRTGEIRELDTESVDLKKIMAILFDNKYAPYTALTDDQFIDMVKEIQTTQAEEPTYSPDPDVDFVDCEDD